MQLNTCVFSKEFWLDKKSVSLFVFLALLPNLVGLISFSTEFGFKFHVFQYVIFLAALIYGPFGGAVSGGFGSIFTALTLNNPYLILGNIILGAVFGLLLKKGVPLFKAGLTAFLAQIPFLYFTDVYLIGMNSTVVQKLIIALFLGNLVWLFLAKFTFNKIKLYFQSN
ncbi:hypothetical protein KKG83_07570 [Candidatus Micrarchaeota archaeon]|nr:hypothetical protein [Candidatus Micrarchaeota archaeon]MBU2477299.1 hypothetical protein [Candidatus Micrarchaeota archaeon]